MIALVVAIIVALYLSKSISTPLSDLADTAVRISNGELDLTVELEREDEIGALAQAFNNMTTRLRHLIRSLEERVADRTKILQRRALQLETSTQVSREITSILDIDELLDRVVSLTVNTFGYYYVAIFLVDEQFNTLVFRSGSGEVETPLSVRENPFLIGPGSLNGEAACRNEIIVVNDVKNDPRYRYEKKIPDTNSELVVPLRVGDRVIGTLDVQSKEMEAFHQDDIKIIQGLGDQVAIAIENARLYAKTRALAVLEERNRLARDLHDSVSQSLYGLVAFSGAGRDLIDANKIEPVREYLERIENTSQQALNEMRILLFELRPPTLEQEGLTNALYHRLSAVEERLGVETILQIDESVHLVEKIEVVIYRIAQEALNNVLKHSKATQVSVRLDYIDRRIELEIKDNGIGFDINELETGGIGLEVMRERTKDIGGTLNILSEPGNGTSVLLQINKSC
jgi:nitrate/nitrite-specific signal transduction histidine kinase